VRKHRIPSICALVILLVVLYAPLVRVVINSFNMNELGTSWEGATLRWFRTALNNDVVVPAMWVSVKIAVLSAMASVVFGTLAVMALRMLPGPGAALVRLGSLARVTTPEIILATGLFVAMPLMGVRFGFTAMLIAHTAYLTGFVVLLVAARAANADPRLEEAAQDLGARPVTVLRTIVWPDLRPAIGAALLLSAAFSFDDVALSRSMSSPTTTTLPLVLVSLVQRRATPEIDAIATLLLVVGVMLFGAALGIAGSVAVVTGSDRPSR
jgi:ABC-type spermidine/putrescine transport system permease subunit II